MNPEEGKLIVFSAPSGSGKTTIVHHLLSRPELPLSFSVSCTTRERREHEVDGEDYHFIPYEEFMRLKEEGAFLEWEEVYRGNFYGTLHRSIHEIWELGRHVIFDIDVVGGLNIKRKYPDRTLAVFVQPPDIETLRKRLTQRDTESPEKIEMRIAKAELELSEAPKFDHIIVNESLEEAQEEACRVISEFLGLYP